MVVVTTTTPDSIEIIAEAALKANIDMMDILLRGDVVDKLLKFRNRIIENNRIFITQCGFHPGLITPLVRMAKNSFDEYQTAEVAMAMEAVFKKSESIKELLYEVIESNSKILENGVWRRANYKDAKDFKFGKPFGQKACYPLQMIELIGLENELGLSQCGVYAGGFSTYIDNFIFPLTMFLGFINKKLSLNICSKLFYKAIKDKVETKPKVEMQLLASGLKDGISESVRMRLVSEDGFELTAKAVVALLKQYLAGRIDKPDLYLMGKVSQETELFRDLKDMGIGLQKV